MTGKSGRTPLSASWAKVLVHKALEDSDVSPQVKMMVVNRLLHPGDHRDTISILQARHYVRRSSTLQNGDGWRKFRQHIYTLAISAEAAMAEYKLFLPYKGRRKV